MPDTRLDHPAVRRMARVAQALGGLAREVVFVGGAVAPLLQIDPPFGAPRPTRDVDAVTASRSYRDVERLHEQLTSLGFRQNPSDTAHIHRWVSPDGDQLDLLLAGHHAGGSGQEWDTLAMATSVTLELGGGVMVRHVSGPVFLAMKWAAFRDRGAGDPFASHDLEDILALLAARPLIVEEVRTGPIPVRQFVASAASQLLERTELDDLLAGHLNNAQDPAHVCQKVRGHLAALAGLGAGGE